MELPFAFGGDDASPAPAHSVPGAGGGGGTVVTLASPSPPSPPSIGGTSTDRADGEGGDGDDDHPSAAAAALPSSPPLSAQYANAPAVPSVGSGDGGVGVGSGGGAGGAEGGGAPRYDNIDPRHFGPAPTPSVGGGVGASTAAAIRFSSNGVGAIGSNGTIGRGEEMEDEETIDFLSDTFVTVCGSDVEEDDEEDEEVDGEDYCYDDAAMATLNRGRRGGRGTGGWGKRGDVLALLLSGDAATALAFSGGEDEASGLADATASRTALVKCREGSAAAGEATGLLSGPKGMDVEAAAGAHLRAARLFRDAAAAVRKADPALAHSLLLISNSQARSADALQRIARSNRSGRSLPAGAASSGGGVGESSGLARFGGSGAGTAATAPGRKSASMAAEASTPPVVGNLRQERLRATIRSGMGTRKEADLTDSTFLGSVVAGREGGGGASSLGHQQHHQPPPSVVGVTAGATPAPAVGPNPVDDMMKLERELRDMDMALEMGSSVASLGARTTTAAAAAARMKSSFDEAGSFCVVPPGSSSVASFMSSSVMWSSAVGGGGGGGGSGRPQHHDHRAQPAGSAVGSSARARANRVQGVRDAPPSMATAGGSPTRQQHSRSGGNTGQPFPATAAHGRQQGGGTAPPPAVATESRGLESSWWGHASATASHMGASIVSAAGGGGRGAGGHQHPHHLPHHHHGAEQPHGGQQAGGGGGANTKELMRLLDTIRTLGDENAHLLREAEEARAARLEAKATKTQMAQFKAEYAKRFKALKDALEKFRRQYPEGSGTERNPVLNSDFVRSTSVSEVHKKDQMIRKLTADLKKERDESRKKDVALQKYEAFYREVKARSAQKAKQRQQEQEQLQRKQKTAVAEGNRLSR